MPASGDRSLQFAPVIGAGGLAKLVLAASDGALAEVYSHGAHVTSWIPSGESEDRLFVSVRSRFDPGAAIRGGIPVCFPQFADQGPLPRHGFARSMAWSPIEAGRRLSGAAHALLRLVDTAETRALWPHPFIAELAVAVAARSLSIELTIENTGPAPMDITIALHTYLRVHNIATTRVHGLQGVRYRDKALGESDRLEAAATLAISGEIDRIYHAAPQGLEVREPDRTTAVRATGFPDTVIWNPGPERAREIDDMEPGGEARMLCVEAAAAARPVTLAAGARWHGTQTLTAG